MIAKVIYKGNLRTEATHLKSGNVIITDAPTDNQGKGEAFSPTDLASTSLASCILTIMGIAAQNHDIDITGSQAEVIKVMASNPRRIAEINIKLIMPTRDYSQKDKKILEAAAHHCPVGLSLHPETKENIIIQWAE
ncbi:MAG: OsmC family protein [Saprospiraceae bacterium]|nr:OsmC family protein [Bacteroidia bacterium]NNL91824.1 OsmC family protein [Saprospiraceae bacterium]